MIVNAVRAKTLHPAFQQLQSIERRMSEIMLSSIDKDSRRLYISEHDPKYAELSKLRAARNVLKAELLNIPLLPEIPVPANPSGPEISFESVKAEIKNRVPAFKDHSYLERECDRLTQRVLNDWIRAGRPVNRDALGRIPNQFFETGIKEHKEMLRKEGCFEVVRQIEESFKKIGPVRGFGK